MSTLPSIRVGTPMRQHLLSVFPLFTAAQGGVDYLLSDEALAAGVVTVEEVSEGGSVRNLRVENHGDRRVLFLEGEELRGAKQNRVLNTSVLVAAHSTLAIPVSCVEQGRWRYRSRQFASSDTHSSSKLRHFLKSSVSRSLKSGQGHSSDQGAVWSEVERQMSSLGSSSETAAMADTFESHKARLAEFREHLKYVDGATGVAVGVGRHVVALDMFDKPETCRKVWDRLLSGVVMDALEGGESDRTVEAADVEALLARLQDSSWEPAPPVGEGEEYRWESDGHTHASALVCEGSVLHGSVIVAS